MFKNKTILQILDKYKDIWALGYTSAVNHWDLETYMPAQGVIIRGEALAKLSSLRQKLFLDPAFVKLVTSAGAVAGLNDYEKGIIRILEHSLRFYKKLPADFLEEFEKLTNKATVVWRESKTNNDYLLFEPYLKKIFDMNRKMADYLGYKNNPYDALLDQYEEGLTVKTVESFFDEIRIPLGNLLDKILKSPLYRNRKNLDKLKYDRGKMVALNEKVLTLFWPEYGKNFRLDVSAHPFTTSFSKFDTRITTWYQPKSFSESLLATVHEFGHALYDLQCASELEMTPIQGGSSLVIHESQSRFWENFVGRSETFIESIIKDLRNATGDKSLTAYEVYRHFNAVSPSLNRVEADEVTYHFHIMLRFEIEKGIIEGKLKFKDLKEIWNSKMEEYLKIKPKKDSDGVLQDIHWSGGTVGYFPTYSLGTFLGAQWESRITQLSNKTDNTINKKQNKQINYQIINRWLAEHIHKYGSAYTLDDLLEKNKMEFDTKVNLKHLQDKYSAIYNFS